MFKKCIKSGKRRLKVIFLLAFFIVTPCTAYSGGKLIKNSLGMTFVLIPAGQFTMGSPADEPGRGTSEKQYQVTISRPFFMQATEVTVGQWQQVMGKRLLGGPKGPATMPVVRVSWHDVMKFIKKLNSLGEGTYRLPTDAEWEYAARAGSETAYAWGSEITCDQAMYSNNSRRSNQCVKTNQKKGLKSDAAAPVKSYAPNSWGLFDMHGNVWEWCKDRFDTDIHWQGLYREKQLTDPEVKDTGENRIRRGGSWFGGATSCRSANRTYSNPGIRYKTTGFRLVRLSS